MSYLIEVQGPAHPSAYIVAQADTLEGARAFVNAKLGRDDAYDDVVIVAVHIIH